MTGYVKSFDKTDGVDTINSGDFEAEFNAIQSAFDQTSGHKHDGTASEGPYIQFISDSANKNKVVTDGSNNEIEFWNNASGLAVQQLSLTDGLLAPVTTNDVDLGSTSKKFKKIFCDNIATSAIFDVKSYGATGNGSTDDTTYIAAAVTAATSTGGIVFFPPGTYITTKITLPSKVILKGSGSANTTIKLKNASNTAVIESKDFSTLTGTNSWFTDTEGVPHGFGLINLTIDGNKSNQTSGNAVNFYGKRYYVEDIIIKDAYSVGLYSECAYKGGQHTVDDLPESWINNLYIYLPGSHGVQYRGPHDGRINSVYISQAGGVGFYVENNGTTYNGTCTIGLVHSYACTEECINIGAYVLADTLVGESGYKEGVVLASTGGSAAISMFSNIHAYTNDRGDTGTYYNVRVASGVQVSNIQIYDTRISAGGVTITENASQIGTINCIGSVTNVGRALNVESGIQFSVESFSANGYSGVTGTGVYLAGNHSRSKLSSYTTSCKTHVNIASPIANGNVFNFVGFQGAGETTTTGTISFGGNSIVGVHFADGVTATTRFWPPSYTYTYLPSTITPANNREMGFELTDNYNVTLRVKDAGGTSRSAILPLVGNSTIINVKAYGAVGNGTTNDLAAFEAADAALVASGGGVLFVPKTTSYYKLSRALLVSPGVVVMGEGYGSYIKCVQATNNPVGGNAALVFGFVAREDLARQRTRGAGTGYFVLDDIAAESNIVTLTTASQYTSFNVGDVVLVASSDNWIAAGQNYWDSSDTISDRPIPQYGVWSVVESSAASGNITLRHQVEITTNPVIINWTTNTYNKTEAPWLATNALDETLYATRDSGAVNLRLEGGGTSTFPLFVNGAVNCIFENLFLVNSHEILRTNGLSHSVVRNINGHFKGWGIELALNSSHNELSSIRGDYIEGALSTDTHVILLGEGCHDNNLSDVWMSCGSHVGLACIAFYSSNNKVTQTKIRGLTVTNQTIAFGKGDGNKVVSCEFWSTGGDKCYWGVNAGSHNVVQRNHFHGLGSGAGIVMAGGTFNECKDNYFEDTGVTITGTTDPVIRNNYMGSTATSRIYNDATGDVVDEFYISGESWPRFRQGATGTMLLGGGAADVDVSLYRGAANRLQTDDQFRAPSVLLVEESSAPDAVSNGAVIYAIDNGAGKTQLMVRFPTGASQQLSIEP